MAKVASAAVLVLGLGLAGRAGADPSASAIEEAKAHLKTGTELYDENNFRGALVELQRAYELAPSYKILFNIGQVDMELQDYAGALTAYTRYLREGASEVPADRVTQVTAEIDKLRARVGHLTIQTTGGAEVLIDQVSVGFAPLPEAVNVNTGRHTVTVRVQGKEPTSRVVDVAGQQNLTVVLGNEAPVVAPPTVIAPPPRPVPVTPKEAAGPPSKTPMIASLSATGGLVIVSTIFMLKAHSDQSDLATLRNSYPVTKQALDDQVSKEKRDALIGDCFGIAALAAAGVGAYFTLHYRSQAAEYDHSVSLTITPTGAAIAGRF
jgi:hypothetical protein